MPFWCGYAEDNGQTAHTHETAAEMRAAHGLSEPTDHEAVRAPYVAPTPAPVPTPTPAPVAPYAGARAPWEPVTRPQLDYGAKLGLDTDAMTLLGKRGSSALIDVRLGKSTLYEAMSKLHGTGYARHDARPAAPAPVAAPEPPPISRRSELPEATIGLIGLVADGYYATRTSPTEPYLFYKVSTPKSGQYKGSRKFMTRHGDDWKTAFVIWPSGRASSYKPGIDQHLLELIANQSKAKLQYARQIGSCCICGKTLTDERSRYYGIGPDCETRHSDIIGWVTDEYGPYVPGRGFDKHLDR